MKKTIVYCDFCENTIEGLSKADINSNYKRVRLGKHQVQVAINIRLPEQSCNQPDCCVNCLMKIVDHGFDPRPKAE